jgi:2-keto-3-deoxy-L-rhamnonate aldolase RhmA
LIHIAKDNTVTTHITNAVKKAAATGDIIRGVHMTFAAPTVIEILAHAKLDFIYLDGEHGAFTPHTIEACTIAAERHGMTVIGRVPDIAPATITNFLDRGVLGIVAPHVHGIEDARRLVDATYYAPLGSRSFGGGRPHYGVGLGDKRTHLAEVNAQVSICVMIECRGALEQAGEIAALSGIDYMSFGLNDLAQDLGFPGKPDHPEVKAAVERASAAIRAAGSRVREDFMNFAWINAVILKGTQALIG